MTYKLTTNAIEDLQELLAYALENYGPQQAIETEDMLFELFERLLEFPGMGHKRDDLTLLPFLFFPASPYLVAYEPGSTPMLIHAVVHGARDLRTVFRTRPL